MAREICLLGPVRVVAEGRALQLPPSRKVRGLLAYLVLVGPQTRSRLCDLFWDDTNDPRAELLANRLDDARVLVGKLRAGSPAYGIDDFFRAFHFSVVEDQRTFRSGAERIGF